MTLGFKDLRFTYENNTKNVVVQKKSSFSDEQIREHIGKNWKNSQWDCHGL